MSLRILTVALFAAGVGCVVDAVHAGDPCGAERDLFCRTRTVAFYCGQGHWLERDCWAECRRLGYEVGSCGVHSGSGDLSCMCGPVGRWTPDEPCAHEGDQACWGDRTLRACIDGRVRVVDCGAVCGGSPSVCTYDPERRDESCVCCETAPCP